MQPFINDSFSLETEAAENLYHNFAKEMPIIDYHCHIPPEEVAKNIHWKNITQIWLYADHYKWRAMRSNGIDEKYCTGNASDRDKFNKYAETMPYLLRNPLYHWTHLELKRYFGIDDLLSPKTADKIWNKTEEVFQSDDFNAQQCMSLHNVETICTTDDPTDDLSWHKIHSENKASKTNMFPTWRPDKALAFEAPETCNQYLDKLGEVSGINIDTYSDLLNALRKRHDFFAENGCKLSDYGIQTVPFAKSSQEEITKTFDKFRTHKEINEEEINRLKSALLLDCGRLDAEKGWTRQLHMGPMRNNNSRMLEKLGPDSGFDSISDKSYAEELSQHLDTLNNENLLGKTILYNLHPKDNEMLATMIGNFQDGITPGKLQLGSGWWFADQTDGMTRQIEALSQLGLLSRFVGMLTDSRSFLSYPRHEYFRRILCNILGNDMKKGLIPMDFELVGNMVKDICYNNAKQYFNF